MEKRTVTGKARRAHMVCGAGGREGGEREAAGTGRGAHRLRSSCMRRLLSWGSEGISGGVGRASKCKERESVKQVF